MTENLRHSLLFLNRSYWPDVEATGQLLTELCEGLHEIYDVRVVAGKPNAVRDSTTESEWQKVSVRNGVAIERVKHWQFPKRRMVFKGLNYLSFIRSTRNYLRKCQAPDAVVFETDPFLLPFEAARLQKRTGCRMIGYLQDIYPDVAVALGKIHDNWAVRKLRESLFSVYRSCDRMVVLSEDMKRLLTDGGVQAGKIDIVPNWSNPETVYPVDNNRFREQHGFKDRFLVMYSGNLGLTQRLEEFVAAAELLSDQPKIMFAFVGQGSQRLALERIVQVKKLSNVQFFDYQPKSELANSLSAADLHLIPLTRELSQCLMPSKLYGILASGRPYLTNAMPESELYSITHHHKVGFSVEPGSPSAIASSIRSAMSSPERLRELGQNARKLALDEFTPAKSIDKFRKVLETALESR